MQIAHVSREVVEHGIPLRGWKSVQAAVRAYASGSVRGSQTALKKTADEIGKASAGGVGAALYVHAAGNATDDFVEELLKSAKRHLRRGVKRWSGSWDYAPHPRFQKTDIDIERLEGGEEMFLLHICAAYVGDAPEAALAEQLGIARAVVRGGVIVETRHDGREFSFDFFQISEILRRLVRNGRSWTGIKILEMLAPSNSRLEPRPVLMRLPYGFVAELRLGRVGHRFCTSGDVSVRAWEARKTFLSGPLAKDHEGRVVPPQFCIDIRRLQEDTLRRKVLWQESERAQLRQLMADMAGAFEKHVVSVSLCAPSDERR